jgi:hypothetical protein
MPALTFDVATYAVYALHNSTGSEIPRSYYQLKLVSPVLAHGITTTAYVDFLDESELTEVDRLGSGVIKADDVFHFRFSVTLRKEEFLRLYTVLSTEKPVTVGYGTDVSPFTPVQQDTPVVVQTFWIRTGAEPVGEGVDETTLSLADVASMLKPYGWGQKSSSGN